MLDFQESKPVLPLTDDRQLARSRVQEEAYEVSVAEQLNEERLVFQGSLQAGL